MRDGLQELPEVELVDDESGGLASGVVPGELSTVELNVDGQSRVYQVYIPENGKEPMSLVYVLHGVKNGDAAGLMDRETEMSRYAEENGFVAVYPPADVGDDGLACTIWWERCPVFSAIAPQCMALWQVSRDRVFLFYQAPGKK